MEQRQSKGTLILILGILSLVCCGLFTGIPAAILGKQELDAIGRGDLPEDGRTMALIGLILGIVGTVETILAVIFYGSIFAMIGMSSQLPGG